MTSPVSGLLFACNIILSHSFQFCFYGDRLPQTPENVLYLSNHQCTSEPSHTHTVRNILCVFCYPHSTSLPLPLPSGLGGGGGVVCETGRMWGEDSLHPQGRHPVPPSLWLGAGRGETHLIDHCLLVHDVCDPLLLILCLERRNICQEEEREGPGEVYQVSQFIPQFAAE